MTNLTVYCIMLYYSGCVRMRCESLSTVDWLTNACSAHTRRSVARLDTAMWNLQPIHGYEHE